MVFRVDEATSRLGVRCSEILAHKAVWITALVISILVIVIGSLVLAQQYGDLGHSFSFLDPVPLGATATLFVVGGLFFTYSISKLIACMSQKLFIKQQSNLLDSSLNITESPLELLDHSVYLGANAEKITSPKGDVVLLPRTLYHLLFIYSALKNKSDELVYPMLRVPFPMDWDISMSELPSLHGSLGESTKIFHSEALRFLGEKNYSSSTTWLDLKKLVTELCHEFKSILDSDKTVGSNHDMTLWYNFYAFCFKKTPEEFGDTVLKALALEWSMPDGTEILYRSSQLSQDNVVREDGSSHSLSFSTSLFSGLVFEGRSNGTCTMSYYKYYGNRELYALRVTPSQLRKYFFYPSVFRENGLIPLFAVGEFSHPRLKIFASTKKKEIHGVQHHSDTAHRLTSFNPTDKIPNPQTYQEKVRKIYKKNLCVLAVS